MASRIVSCVVFFVLFGCAKQQNTQSSLLDFIPSNSAVVFKINDLSLFKNELKNNAFIAKLEHSTIYNTILEEVRYLGHIDSKAESLLAFSAYGADNYEFTFVTDTALGEFALDSLQQHKNGSSQVKNHTIHQINIDSLLFYGTQIDEKLIMSSSKGVLENLITYFGKDRELTSLAKLYKISTTDNSATMFINTAHSTPLLKDFQNEGSELRPSSFADWVSIDLKTSKNNINLNGISMANDSVRNFVHLFKGTNPLVNMTATFAPLNANAILSYTFDDYKTFAENQRRFLGLETPKDSLLNTVEEIGFIYRNNTKAIVLNTYGSHLLSEFITNNKRSETEFQGHQIVGLSQSDFLNDILDPIVKNFKADYVTVIENAFVFSADRNIVQAIIRNHKSGSTFEKTDVYVSAQDVLADESSILFVSNDKGIESLLKEDFTKRVLADFEKANLEKNTFAAQLVADDNFYHTNIVVQQTRRKSNFNTVSPLFTIQLDEELGTDPQFVVNHRTNKMEIIVQDVTNTLYLISTDGKIIWKKQLKGQIQGKIHQVDLYKNRRLQLAFTTNDQFIILDRNGKEVSPFTMNYEGGNLNPLAVFDYENNKEYRFVVTQGDKVFMYNSKAAIVKGFKYTKAESAVLKAPKHIRIAKKDYLVFQLENGSLKILNRVGNVRTKVSDKIDFSGNEVYLYKNKFIVSDKKGGLYQIGTNGSINKTELRLNADHGLDATSKSLVYMNDNVLNIKGKKVELEFGVYTAPKIFYIYDKIYVGVTDIQNQKVHLYDSQANPIKNFPVFGSSNIDVIDMENDRKLELVTQDQKNAIIVYQLN